jgi:hypothetical protein
MTDADTSMLDSALAYAHLGWYVVPLHTPRPGNSCSCRSPECASKGKHPRTRNGLKDASNDPTQIESWWSMWPDANIALVTGPSGLVAIDVDPRHGGDEDWKDLKEKHGKSIQQTVSSQTGGGGEHYLYLQPGEMTIGNVSNSDKYTGPLGRGIDVRAEGGYIVAPPSLHESGNRYEWYEGESPFERDPQRLPLAFAEALSAPARQQEHTEPINAADILKGVPEGTRDWTLFQLASKLRYADVPIDWAYALVEAAAAKSLDSKGNPFPRAEARKKVDSAYTRYNPGAGAWVSEQEAQSIAAQDAPAAWVDWSTFWDIDPRAEDWLIEPVIPRGRSIALYSPAKQGKSLFTLDIVVRAATGQRVLDRPEGDPLTVVYFDLEMTEDDLYERLEDMGYGRETDLSHLFYYLLPALPPLDTFAGGQKVLEIARLHNADLVVIDTTSRVLGGPENDSDTMRAFYMYTGLPLKADGRTVLRLDHAGKSLERGMRGTSAKNDDVDLVWELKAEDEDAVKLRATHRRQSWVPETVIMSRRPDPLRHERTASTWPQGTAWLAEELDKLGIPVEWGARKVRKTLRENNVSARNETVAAAIRYRKIRPSNVSPNSGDTWD